MIKLKTHATLAAILASAMAVGIATPSIASEDNTDQTMGATAAYAKAGSKYGAGYYVQASGAQAYSYAPGSLAMAPGFNGDIGNDVFVNGNYVGSDPDPRIRASIRDEERGNVGND